MSRVTQRGFTLIELVIVLLLVAILSVVVVPEMSRVVDDMRARAAAREIAAHIQYAQSIAVTECKVVAVQFESTGFYIAEIGAVGDVGAGETVGGTLLDSPLTHKAMEFSTAGPGPMAGITISDPTFGGEAWFAFEATGSPNTSGTVDVSLGTCTYRVTVAAGTGRVTVD